VDVANVGQRLGHAVRRRQGEVVGQKLPSLGRAVAVLLRARGL
jgi:hypothetical protein